MGDRLAAFALRVRDDAYFLAEAFEEYARSEQLDDGELASVLGCQVVNLGALRLCRRPRPEQHFFRQDITVIAERFDLEPAGLAQVLRRADAIRTLRVGTGNQEGFLMAARDRSDGTANSYDDEPGP